ncbi:DNA alkylation repair protein [Saccharomonospora cyanea]|uniref:Putative DNA alkylation repair enzyme n=1 Tax=Saccharomonospora cyanea NA-134 TaxID=882082 RepID=H5XQ22_9PSEU|nr:DNA alkylation repair protein [Saccharomonospora cyanea]EHR62247.1 putative DNA alkylation repair enzyme [Saccharomonospora cyanea NA-134]
MHEQDRPHDSTPVVTAVRKGLAELADPEKAPAMQRYMRSAMPFLGVQKPERHRLARQIMRESPLPDRESWQRAVLELWDHATYREERYLALDLTGHRAYARWQTPDLLPLYEHLVATGAWWDFVDEIAVNRIGPLLRADFASVAPVLRSWARDPDRWKRRVAVLSQNASGVDTDTALLTDCIEANLADPDFFLRKAIGWALRQYARTDPDWVEVFVANHPGLSPLSRREALRHRR